MYYRTLSFELMTKDELSEKLKNVNIDNSKVESVYYPIYEKMVSVFNNTNLLQSNFDEFAIEKKVRRYRIDINGDEIEVLNENVFPEVIERFIDAHQPYAKDKKLLARKYLSLRNAIKEKGPIGTTEIKKEFSKKNFKKRNNLEELEIFFDTPTWGEIKQTYLIERGIISRIPFKTNPNQRIWQRKHPEEQSNRKKQAVTLEYYLSEREKTN